MKPNGIALLAVALTAHSAWSQVPTPGFGDKGCSNKPPFAQNVPITDDDYIEVQQFQSYSRSPVYTVRVYGDGRVVWRGEAAVSVVGDATESADAARAKALIAKARDLGFGGLCDQYVMRGFDGGISLTRVNIGGQTKTVANQGPSNAPPWLYKLHGEVAALPPVQKLIGAKQVPLR
jgi:Domain of unknown function (DUF6438)